VAASLAGVAAAPSLAVAISGRTVVAAAAAMVVAVVATERGEFVHPPPPWLTALDPVDRQILVIMAAARVGPGGEGGGMFVAVILWDVQSGDGAHFLKELFVIPLVSESCRYPGSTLKRQWNEGPGARGGGGPSLSR
jgi:hypothetical protein